MTAGDTLLAVARILQPHGLRGAVYAVSLAPETLDFPSLVTGRPLTLRFAPSARTKHPGQNLPPTVSCDEILPHKEGWMLAFAEIQDRTAAEGLKGAELCLRRSELPPLPDGWHWEADLEGLPVLDAHRGPIGSCVGLEQIGNQWSLKVRVTSTDNLILIPLASPLVPVIDPVAGSIQTSLPQDYPGLDDIQRPHSLDG